MVRIKNLLKGETQTRLCAFKSTIFFGVPHYAAGSLTLDKPHLKFEWDYQFNFKKTNGLPRN